MLELTKPLSVADYLNVARLHQLKAEKARQCGDETAAALHEKISAEALKLAQAINSQKKPRNFKLRP